jgi:hypothetical protein
MSKRTASRKNKPSSDPVPSDEARVMRVFEERGDALSMADIAWETLLSADRTEAALAAAVKRGDLVRGRDPSRYMRTLRAPKLGDAIPVVYNLGRNLSIEAVVVFFAPGVFGRLGMFVAVSARGVHRGHDDTDLIGKPVWSEMFSADMEALVEVLVLAAEIRQKHVQCAAESIAPPAPVEAVAASMGGA